MIGSEDDPHTFAAKCFDTWGRGRVVGDGRVKRGEWQDSLQAHDPDLAAVGDAHELFAGARDVAQDVPPPIEPIVSFALGITLTDTPVHRVELVLPDQLPYLQELDSITQNRDVRYTYDGCAVNNFTVDSRAMGCLLATWQQNGLAE